MFIFHSVIVLALYCKAFVFFTFVQIIGYPREAVFLDILGWIIGYPRGGLLDILGGGLLDILGGNI